MSALVMQLTAGPVLFFFVKGQENPESSITYRTMDERGLTVPTCN